ncbi:MAG: iron-containing alcohol dehydrogenase [Firmicutes bacterium]|nr:iron-containing alcohol dehydrogenase [Bacillota bacterium]
MGLYAFKTAGKVIVGRGALAQAGPEAAALGKGKALVVTDGTMVDLGLADKLVENLAANGVQADVFPDVEPEPSMGTAIRCAARLGEGGYDLVVGLGGGSCLDVAKAGAAAMDAPESLPNYLGTNKVPGRSIGLFLIPTTAGTGTEVTPNAIVLDTDKEEKQGIVSPYLYADVSLVDPELTVSKPPAVTAATGMDALTHAIEAFVSKNASPMTDLLALEAVSLIGANLRRAVADGSDIEAREQMMFGSMLAGMAFANAGLGAVHAIAMAMGGFGVTHGRANALMLPYVMRFNRESNPEKFARLAVAMGLDLQGLSVDEAGEQAVEAVARLGKDVGCPQTLPEVGIGPDRLDLLVRKSFDQQRLLKNNPRPAGMAELEQICRSALG